MTLWDIALMYAIAVYGCLVFDFLRQISDSGRITVWPSLWHCMVIPLVPWFGWIPAIMGLMLTPVLAWSAITGRRPRL